ncbi:SgcJ/EcaC family oxidoreductase [Ideonella azotifigens]|uniref:Calcium/calmodulin-dependent protein kinase type II n=1 Tax=Ideonella azotifigens TaxID=513160 RepID=A0ABN1JTE5_9BURK|nr:SgcJ/EcaC family oxidoreductase [Ideonella azotifigens]MCD2341009.1 SgcJ/EcaC family oxidoreductase [Ideonella azotifigens]
MKFSTLSPLFAAASLALGLSTPALAQDDAGTSAICQATSEQQVAALFDRWNASLRTLDPDKVVANYAPDGVLLPTVSNEPRTSPAEIRDYFVKFLKSEPQGTIDKRLIRIGCNVAQDVGTYTFQFKDGQTVKARYTYVYEWENGQWLIAHHHSSAMPEPVAGAK